MSNIGEIEAAIEKLPTPQVDEAEGLTLVTGDSGRYRTYFPSITIISPP